MDGVLHKHLSEDQHCCRIEVRCRCFMSLSSVSLLFQIVLADDVRDRDSKILQHLVSVRNPMWMSGTGGVRQAGAEC